MVIPSTPGLPLLLRTRFHALTRFPRSHTSSISCSAQAGRSGAGFATGGSVPWCPRPGASPRPFGTKASEYWIFCRVPLMSCQSYLPLSIVWAFGPRFRLDLSVAPPFSLGVPPEPCRQLDLICPLLTSAPRSDDLTVASVACGRHETDLPGVSSIAFGAQPPDLRFASLMDMDFATSCPLVQRWRLVSGFCSSARTFAPRFLQTPPRGDSPCASLTLHLHQVG